MYISLNQNCVGKQYKFNLIAMSQRQKWSHFFIYFFILMGKPLDKFASALNLMYMYLMIAHNSIYKLISQAAQMYFGSAAWRQNVGNGQKKTRGKTQINRWAARYIEKI